jgi:uncharacterized protein (TIGR02147 family)
MTSEIREKIFAYDNYRFFLRDFFREQKRMRAIFSHRFLAQRAGFSSSSFCAHVIEGKRNLTSNSLQKMMKGLGLAGKAAAYFEALVRFNQAKTVDDREHQFRVLERLRRSTEFYRINQRQFAYYDEWYFPIVRELAVYGKWAGDFALLAKMVRPPITPERAQRAVEMLIEIGLLHKTPDGRFEQASDAVTAEEVPS